jgi:hypothetical protein
MKGNYAVLTPEKIEEISEDLELGICTYLHGLPFTASEVKRVLESKKQELLKSIQK